ncbi:MAG: hypothetical protein ACTHNY_06270 [Solirubrobacterales bacterium]
MQSLVPLASALGAGTIFGLFFGGRKRAGFAVFEVFAMVSVLVAVGSTAYLAIAILHSGEAITDADLTQTATPLILGAFLLVFVSILGRLPGSFERLLFLVPLAFGAAVIAAAIVALSASSTDPGHASLVAVLVLVVGGILGLLTAWIDRMDLSWDRRIGYNRLVRLTGEGYLSEWRALALGLPATTADGERPMISCWVQRGRVYLDADAPRRLRAEADAGWDAHVESKAAAPSGARSLLRVKVGIRLPLLRPRRRAQLVTLESRERRFHDLKANEDGLFNVTALELFG